MKIKCPRCQSETEYAESNAFRPFCSERCQTIDLGAWADGSYTIPVTDPQALQELAEQFEGEQFDAEQSQQSGSETEPDENVH